MGELKPGWKRVNFGQVVRLVKDKVDPESSGLERFVAGEHMDSDDLRIRRWGDIGGGYLGPAFHMHFRPGQVLYGSRRTYLRKVAVAEFEGICANTTFVLESADPQVLLPDLLPFIMSTEAFHEHSKRESKGSVNPYVNFSDLAWYEFALPPLEEQRRISKVLASTWRCVEVLQAAIDASTEQYRSLAMHLFTRGAAGGTANPSAWAPSDWGIFGLGEMTDPDSPICYGIVQVGDDVIDGVPTLAIKNLTNAAAAIHRTSKAIEDAYVRSRVHGGDIVVAIKATIGPIARVPPSFQGNISRDLARIRLDERRIVSDYFVHLWRSPAFNRYISSLTVGSTRAELSIALLRDLRVPAPDLHEQARIVEALSEVDASTESLLERVTKAKALHRAGIHHALICGAP